MKVSQLRSAIKEYQDVVHACGDNEAAIALRDLNKIFENADGLTIAAFIKKVERGRAILSKEQKR